MAYLENCQLLKGVRGPLTMQSIFYLEKLQDFTRMILGPALTPSEVCRYLRNQVLSDFDIEAVMYCELANDAQVRFIASSGIPEEFLDQIPPFSSKLKVPTNDALLNNKIVWVENEVGGIDLLVDYPDLVLFPQTHDWKTLIVFPAYRSSVAIGALSLVFRSTLLPNEEFENFIWSVAHLSSVSIYQKRGKFDLENSVKILNSGAIENLTPRQVLILKLISEGHTNESIANQLKYSHSTIRQETIRIFAKLNVFNREEASILYQNISAERELQL